MSDINLLLRKRIFTIRVMHKPNFSGPFFWSFLLYVQCCDRDGETKGWNHQQFRRQNKDIPLFVLFKEVLQLTSIGRTSKCPQKRENCSKESQKGIRILSPKHLLTAIDNATSHSPWKPPPPPPYGHPRLTTPTTTTNVHSYPWYQYDPFC